MTLTLGSILPDADLIQMTDDGPQNIVLSERMAGRKIVLFGVPGAFTPTCSTAHVPSFIRTASKLFAKGIDEIMCVSVNDAHVMRAWGDVTGGTNAGISFLADADSAFTKSIGMQFDAPAVGMFQRSKRYSMLVDYGRVTIFNKEIAKGSCELSGGEALLGQI